MVLFYGLSSCFVDSLCLSAQFQLQADLSLRERELSARDLKYTRVSARLPS